MNQLLHLGEFRTALANYQLSESATHTLTGVRFALLVGPTSSGRNTIINELQKTGAYHYVVSDTTREPRVKNGVPIEQNGREYWFRKEVDVLGEVQHGDFLEAAVIHGQQVSGISIREIEAARADDKIAITDVEPHGAAVIHRLKPDTIILFVVPPDFATWTQRLRRRSDLPEAEIRRRLQTSADECTAALAADFYTFVVNDTFEHAVADIDNIVRRAQTPSAESQAAARAVAEQLLHDIRVHLAV